MKRPVLAMGWFTNLSTTTCFGLYTGHHQVVTCFKAKPTI